MAAIVKMPYEKAPVTKKSPEPADGGDIEKGKRERSPSPAKGKSSPQKQQTPAQRSVQVKKLGKKA